MLVDLSSVTIQFFVVYFLLINIVTWFVFWFDKYQSRNGQRRVSEMKLWVLALVGGSVGALFGMSMFRHKTKKLSFQAGIALILALQVWLIYFFTNNK